MADEERFPQGPIEWGEEEAELMLAIRRLAEAAGRERAMEVLQEALVEATSLERGGAD